MTAHLRPVVVWGNCQAAPLADLLRAPLARHGLNVLSLPPVYEIDAAGLAAVRELLPRAAALVTTPVRDEYRFAGCGSEQLAALLPPGGIPVRVPSCFDTGPFPWQVNAHGADGARVPAPLTNYHDLRLLAAAGRGDDGWRVEPPAGALAELAAAALAGLRRREQGVDVMVSDAIRAPGAMWAVNHPANRTLALLAAGVLARLGVTEAVDVPGREFLGATRVPVEPAVAAALGWPAEAAGTDWTIDRRTVSPAEIAAAHLAFYATRPDIVVDARTRYADRLAALGL